MSDKVQLLDLLKQYSIYPLSDYQGSCPCMHLNMMGIEIDIHCWKSGCRDCCCEYSGIHISAKEDMMYSNDYLQNIGNEILNQIKERWSNTDWNLVIKNNC